MFPDLTPGGSWADSTVRKELGAEVQTLTPATPMVSGEHVKDVKGLPPSSLRHCSWDYVKEGKTMKYKFKVYFNTNLNN